MCWCAVKKLLTHSLTHSLEFPWLIVTACLWPLASHGRKYGVGSKLGSSGPTRLTNIKCDKWGIVRLLLLKPRAARRLQRSQELCWLLSEGTVAHLGWHQFQYCRQNHETLRLPAESRRSFVHTKHATFVLCLFWTTVLPKGNQNGVPVRSGSTRASGIQVKWDTSDCPLQSSSVYRKIPHEVSIIVGWSDRIYIAMVKWDSWYRVGQALQYVTYNEQSHFTNLWG